MLILIGFGGISGDLSTTAPITPNSNTLPVAVLLWERFVAFLSGRAVHLPTPTSAQALPSTPSL
jgi:hypothetical protein